jgi:hypothetical protein
MFRLKCQMLTADELWARTIHRKSLGVLVPECHEVVYELKCVIAACHQQLGAPAVTEQMIRDLREAIQKIELSIELLQAVERNCEPPECA